LIAKRKYELETPKHRNEEREIEPESPKNCNAEREGEVWSPLQTTLIASTYGGG